MNAKLKFWIVVSLVAVFAIGVAVGYFGERYVVHKRHEPREDQRGDGRPPHFPTVETLAKDLGLNPEQQDKIREIFRNNEPRLEAFGGEFHKRLGELRDQLMAEVKAVLTPEQKAKLEARIREFKEKKRKDSEDSRRDPPRKREDEGEVR
jgi:Spy/CpxP family protein refolding chaperone